MASKLLENPVYRVWADMKTRCTNSKRKDYKNYGGRGIGFDPKWVSFSEFEKDMASKYKKGLTLDRIDNDKGYSKENCQWVSMKEQVRNRRNTHIITHIGKSFTLQEWAEFLGVNRSTLAQRLYVYKMPIEQVLQ